jgi:osmotically-inducible protein OsmY
MSVAVSPLASSVNRSDQQLESQIRRQLAADSRAVSRLEIEVEAGVVTLRGIATSFYQKQLWLHGTKRVAGGDVAINDEIDVTDNWEVTDFAYATEHTSPSAQRAVDLA